MFCILILNLVLLQAYGELLIVPEQSTLTRDQYKSFIAQCKDLSENRVLRWRSPHGNDILANTNDRVTVEHQSKALRLRIRNLTIDDQGTWECIGTNAKGQQTQKSFQMTVRVPVIFQGDSVQYVALGESAIVKCHVPTNSKAEISWFKGHDKVRIENSNYEMVPNGLRIKHVDMSDNDVFLCRADVLETGESRDYPISVVVSKPISQARITCANPCAIEEKTATLICEASGLPSPKYLWFHGSDSPIVESQVPKFVVRGNQLTINYVSESDNGKYSCQAFNEYDRKGQRAEYNLNVIVPPRLATIAPIEISFDSQHPQRVSFQCRVERGSSDSLSLEWQYMNYSSIQSTNGIIVDKSQFTKHRLIELRFDPVRREHFGNYSCIAKNLADSTYSLASLLIHFSPAYVGPNTSIVTSIPNLRTLMRCRFEAYPQPQIQWIKMIRTIQDPQGRVLAVDIDSGVNDITTKQIGTLLYESILSYTPTENDFNLSFECRALNPRVGRHAFTLQRAQPPKRVNVTHIRPLSNGAEVFIQPSENDDLPITQYILKYDVLNPKSSQLGTLVAQAQKSSTQVIKIENLLPNTIYQLLVVAESYAGIGQQTEPIQFQTLERHIPEFTVDENINRTCSNDESCVVTWHIESDGGAPIIKTEILYAQAKDDNDLEIEGPISLPTVLDSSTTEYELTNLKPDTNYFVIIKMYNEVGAAEKTFRIKTRPESDEFSKVRRKSLVIDDQRVQSNRWIIIGIVVAIVFTTIVIVTVCVLIRIYQLGGKHETTNSDHQTTPMMNGDHHSDKTNGYTNSHSSSTKISKSTSDQLFLDDDSV